MVDRWNPWTFTAPIAAKLETSSVRPITAYPVPPSHMQERQYVLEMAIRVACLWQHAWRAYGNTRGLPMPIRVACLCQYAWRAYANTRGLPMATRVACLCQYAWRAYANTRGVPRRAAPSVVVNWATGPASHRLQTAARAPAVIGRCVSRAPAETRLHHIGSATPHEIVV